MKLKIDKIILYPNDRDLTPRIIEFNLDKVNVISGYSQRGKSSIIQIIDYCLGSSDCNIPIGKIRDKVFKFALEVSIGDRKAFIARNSPNENKTAFYLEEFDGVSSRAFNYKKWSENAEGFKINRETLINFLGGFAGFQNVSLSEEEKRGGFDSKVTFRDTSAFQFQPQSIVANPTTMFYKTESFEHLMRLRILFPLVLGYKSYEIIELEKQIELLEKDEKDKVKRFEDIERQYESWQSEVYRHYLKAIDLGLTQSDISIDSSKVDLIKEELFNIVKSAKNGRYTQIGSSSRFADKLIELQISRDQLARELDSFRIQLLRLKELDHSASQYISKVAIETENRLSPVDWFINQRGTNDCPFCEASSEKALNELLNLSEIRRQNQQVIRKAQDQEFSFAKEKQELTKTVSEKEKQLQIIERNLHILNQEKQATEIGINQVFEFIGKIEHVLENLDKISPSGELFKEIELLRGKIATERTKIYKLKNQFDRDHCLEKVQKCIKHYIDILPIEDKYSKTVILDPERAVNIKIRDTNTNDETFLWRIGSGANHMCFHIATLLGIHEYFVGLEGSGKRNFVPSFLIIDQPSQVYFPDMQGEDQFRDEDSYNTTLIFNAFADFTRRTEGKTQLIILEHARESTWENLDNILLVEEWRSNEDELNALLPISWMMN